MKCATCETENPNDSKFCHACGSRLTPKEAEAPPVAEEQNAAPPEAAEKTAEEPSAEERERRKQRVAELLPRAFAFAEKGALVEAIATAEEAAGLVPGSSAAHALLATLYEKAGQNEKALNCLKKVAELNPDAPLDEERMARLRRARAASASDKAPEKDEAPSPVKFWAPRVGAALAFSLVLGIGFSVLRQPQETPKKRPNRLTVSVRQPGAAIAAPLAGLPRPAFVPPPTTGDVDPFVSKSGWRPETPNPGRPDTTTNRRRRQEERDPAPRRRSSLPQFGAAQEPASAGVPPVNVTLPGDPINNSSGGERISAAPPSSPSSPPSSSRKSSGEGDGGYVRIEMHPASGDSSPKSDEGAKSKENGDPVSEAQALQNAGRYRDALRSWREVLASSGSRGEVYQNVGICYQRLGDRTAARDAYAQAIDVYRTQAQRGASAEAALRGIETCRAALELLGA